VSARHGLVVVVRRLVDRARDLARDPLRFRHDGNNPTFDGTEPQRSITFFASDNGGASTTTTTINFNTVNQPAVIGGDTSGSVTEDGTQTTGGTLTIDDPDNGDTFVPFTNQPGLLPGRVSHGCIRVPNWNIVKLKRLMPVGTPVRIHR
jgi:hypothetical protein